MLVPHPSLNSSGRYSLQMRRVAYTFRRPLRLVRVIWNIKSRGPKLATASILWVKKPLRLGPPGKQLPLSCHRKKNRKNCHPVVTTEPIAELIHLQKSMLITETMRSHWPTTQTKCHIPSGIELANFLVQLNPRQGVHWWTGWKIAVKYEGQSISNAFYFFFLLYFQKNSNTIT